MTKSNTQNSQERKEIKFPKTRIATLDVCEVGRKKHHMKALLEIDVTETRRSIKEYRAKTKNKLSFTAFMVKAISSTLEEFPEAHAFLKGKRKAVVFEDIDISIMVERKHAGQLVPLAYVLRQTNKKKITEIHDEIEAAKNQTVIEEDIVLGEKRNNSQTNLYYALPVFLRKAMWKYLMLHPKISHRMMGSVALTSIGMMGQVNGWFIHTSIHPIAFGLGSVIKKPRVIRDEVVIREILNMTMLIDHDVIDGAPMARFVSRLVENIERGMPTVE